MTTTTENIRTWATTNAGNATADAAITSADTQAPDTLDNNVRSIMAAVRRQSDDQSGAIVAGGTSTALTATTASGIASGHIANGLFLKVRTASAATGAATIAVDGLSAVAIKKNNGTAIAADDWASGAFLNLTYSSTATAFIVDNLPQAIGGAAKASFSAHKNGTNQTISSAAATKLTWSTEAFDTGSYFASDKWVPPAGTVLVSAAAVAGALTSGVDFAVYMYKNGALLNSGVSYAGAGLAAGAAATAITSANGTDYFEVYVISSDSSYTVTGTATATYFQGTMI